MFLSKQCCWAADYCLTRSLLKQYRVVLVTVKGLQCTSLLQCYNFIITLLLLLLSLNSGLWSSGAWLSRRLTFAFGWPGNLSFCTKHNYAGHPGFQEFRHSGCCTFLRAQPWNYSSQFFVMDIPIHAQMLPTLILQKKTTNVAEATFLNWVKMCLQKRYFLGQFI